MNILNAIQKISNEFPIARTQPVKNHPLRKFIETEFPNIIKNSINQKYHYLKISSSAQQGRWVTAPWAIFLHKAITKSAQEGFYPSISFTEDCKQLILHIGQGIDDLKKNYGKEWITVSKSRALIMKHKLPEHKPDFKDNPSQLKNYRKSKNLTITSQFGKVQYINKIKNEEDLINDISNLLNLFELLIERGGINNEDISEDTKELIIQGTEEKIVKKHIQIEKVYYKRNQKLIKSLKENSDYCCEACGFNFNKFYKDSPNYIEAHHIVPISEMTSSSKTTTKDDIALLCSNCHKMIHKFGCPNLEDFKKFINSN